LYRYQYGFGDVPDDFQVADLAGGSAVQVDDVQSGRPQGLPFQGYIEWVVGENDFPFIVTLVQADTFAAPQVNRWYYVYLTLPDTL
jgi:hypothetical protein